MNAPIVDQSVAFVWVAGLPGLRALQAEWLALAEEIAADVYARPDWMEVWWDHFGKGRALACVAARVNGVLVGVLPFVIETVWLGPLPCRIARLAGTDPNCLIFQLSVRDEWVDRLLAEAARHLLDDRRCLAISFTPISDRARYLAALKDISQRDPHVRVQQEGAGIHIVFDFPDGFEAYFAALSKKRRTQFRRDVRGLTELFHMTAEAGAPDAVAFQDFVDFHTAQWLAVKKGGHFNDWPGSADFYRDLAERTAKAKLVQLDRLVGANCDLAAEFSLVAGTTSHWRLPARKLDPDVERLSAGKIVFLYMFERLIASGITMIEGGRGDYGYKLDYGGQAVAVHRLLIYRPAARLRLRALLVWADLLHLLYYRIWFLKVLPMVRKQFGGKPRPLWRLWIRTRL